MIIADIWQWTPFIFILALASLQSLPRSALEAARLDGATAWQQAIWHIKIPLMAPVLIVTALLRLIDAFKVLEVILVLTKGGPGLSTEISGAADLCARRRSSSELGVAAAHVELPADPSAWRSLSRCSLYTQVGKNGAPRGCGRRKKEDEHDARLAVL